MNAKHSTAQPVTDSRPIKSGSLFTGIGGFDLGFAQAGIEPAWQCEIDKAARSVLARRFPGVPCYEDVRNVGSDNVAAVDLICGGFPCQDLSVAGKRAGLAGERSGLWFEFRRVIAEIRPKWVVVENVPGLLSSNGGADFAVILRGLVECGYGVAWRVLDAQYFGVAQRRRRVFIVGSLGDGRASEVLFEREGLFGDRPTLQSITGNPSISWNGDITPKFSTEISLTLRAEQGGEGVGVIAFDSMRTYTPTECERLQGFPDGWTDGQSDSARYRQLGNAVAVPVIRWIGERIVRSERETK